LLQRLRGVYYGWWIVASTFVVNAIGTGVFFLGFSVFFLPIQRDLDISRAAASLPFSLSRIVSGVTSPLLGFNLDRIGASRVLMLAGLLCALGFIFIGLSQTFIMFLLVFMFLLTPGFQGGLDTPTTATVSRWFVKKRAVALSLGSVGYALGGFILTPLLAISVVEFGWRPTAIATGIFIAVVVLPLALVLKGSPEEKGLQPDGAPATPLRPGESRSRGSIIASSDDFTFKEALRTPAFWCLSISYGFRGMVWNAIMIHIVAIMVWKGMDEGIAGPLLGVFPLLWIPATLTMGWLSGRWPKQRIAAVAGLANAVGLLLFLTFDSISLWHMLLIFALFAPSEGSWALAWAMLADQFGRKNFGAVRGGMQAVFSVMGIGAPFYSGWVYDRTESYTWAIIPAAIGLCLAGVLNWFMPQARKPASTVPAEPSLATIVK
jgi:sugar phosphate permease